MHWYERLDEQAPGLPAGPDGCEHDEPMSRHTSFRIGGPARRMAFPEQPGAAGAAAGAWPRNAARGRW